MSVTFAMTLFWAKKSQKLSLLGEEKKSKTQKLFKKFHNYVATLNS